MESDQHEDSEFFGIKPQQSQYELQHFDQRDQEFLTRLSILSQQCILLRSRNSSLQKENDSLRQEISLALSELRAQLLPLQALHQKVTSIYAVLAMLGALILGLLEAFKTIKAILVGK